MANYAAGLLFAALLYFSSAFGTILFLTPLLPLLRLRPSLGRRIGDALMSTWKVYAVVSLRWTLLSIDERQCLFGARNGLTVPLPDPNYAVEQTGALTS